MVADTERLAQLQRQIEQVKLASVQPLMQLNRARDSEGILDLDRDCSMTRLQHR